MKWKIFFVKNFFTSFILYIILVNPLIIYFEKIHFFREHYKSFFSLSVIIGALIYSSFFMIFSISKPKSEVIVLDINLDNVISYLYKNEFNLDKKIGDYYIFKFNNFFLKNYVINLREYNNSCVIIVNDKKCADLIKKINS